MTRGFDLIPGAGDRSRRDGEIGLVLLVCAGGAVLIAALPFALRSLIARFHVPSAAEFWRPVVRPPSRVIGPSIGWPAFVLYLLPVAALGWWTWTGWLVTSRWIPGFAALVWAANAFRDARPWGLAREGVPSRLPFGGGVRSLRR